MSSCQGGAKALTRTELLKKIADSSIGEGNDDEEDDGEDDDDEDGGEDDE